MDRRTLIATGLTATGLTAAGMTAVWTREPGDIPEDHTNHVTDW